MLNVSHFNLGMLIETKLPEGKTQEELIEITKIELEENKEKFYGEKVYIMGRITTAMSMYVGHYLAHICKEIYLFDPKENKWVSVIKH